MPYWKRIWIIQEIVLAKKAHLQYGALSVSLAVFEDFLIAMRPLQPFSRLIEGRQSTFFKLVEDRYGLVVLLRRRRQKDGLTLRDVISSCGDAEASEPRDKINGVLGLVSRGAGLYLKPEYQRCGCSVYLKATRTMVRDHDPNNLAIILPRTWSSLICRLFAGLFPDLSLSSRGFLPPARDDYSSRQRSTDHAGFEAPKFCFGQEWNPCDGRSCGTFRACVETPEILQEYEDMKRHAITDHTEGKLIKFDGDNVEILKRFDNGENASHGHDLPYKTASTRKKLAKIVTWTHLIRTSVLRLGKESGSLVGMRASDLLR
ncbi:hypothetical protein BU16DRAFT_341503 [Lophium mytilinum]|uniref:Heterokaryon incompatibility domain-containing protein n=1 Tax=Lophium mytilinum TaxID=390894 RepID=A0A6A6QX97_9PEZI|nr:hypothetical protein BU16DRAFT_341503 [Lophium mytilinum]